MQAKENPVGIAIPTGSVQNIRENDSSSLEEGSQVEITVFACQPFESRRGIDTVVGLRFSYTPHLIELIKQTLAPFRPDFNSKGAQPGGWWQAEKVWWVERSLWPTMREALEAAGCRMKGEE